MIEERVKITAPYLTRSSLLAPQSCKGFTLLEMIVVISLVAILAGMLLQRVWFYQEQAEKVAMEQVAGALQTALVLQYGKLLTHGQESEAGTLATENPLRWLMQKPPNYSGEYYAIQPATIAAGNWAFDLKSRELVYLPYHADYLDPGTDGHKWVRYHVRLEYEQARGSKHAQELAGVIFEPVAPYQWFVQR
jgi:general secretion pathway protein G